MGLVIAAALFSLSQELKDVLLQFLSKQKETLLELYVDKNVKTVAFITCLLTVSCVDIVGRIARA